MAKASPVYDPEADERPIPQDAAGVEHTGANPYKSDYTPDYSDDDMRDIAGISPEEEDALESDALNDAEEAGDSFFNPQGDGDTKPRSGKGESSNSLVDAEKQSGKSGGLYNPVDKPGRFSGARSTIGKLAKNKWLVGITVGGSGGIFVLIALVLLMIGPYKLVNFAEHIAVYQFARTTRQMATQTDRITAEKIAIDSADDTMYKKLKAKYGDSSGKVKETWSKFDKYRPNKVITNMGDEGKLKFNYEPSGIFGREKLKSVTLNGEEIQIRNNTARNLVPGYKFGKNISFSRDFAPTLNNTLKANEVGPIVRARVAKQIRQELGVTLTAWLVGKYAGKTDTEARAQIERDAYKASKGNATPQSVRTSGNSVLDDPAEKAAQAELDAVNSDDGIKAILDAPDEIPAAAKEAIDSGLSTDKLKTGLGFVNPIYGVAVPICMVYEGSLTESGPSIDEQSAQLQRSAIWMQAGSSQTKDGRNASAEAIGATDWKLGDITKSNAEKRASGLPVDTTGYASTQQSRAGTYSIADALLPEPLDSAMNQLASVCPTLTNLWVGIGLGVGNIALIVVSGGSAAGGEAAVTAAADAAIPSLATRIVSRLVTTRILAKQLAVDTVKQGAAIGAATVIAKWYVMSQIGSAHSSLATGPQYADDIDSGTNMYANQVQQRQFYGAPLPDSELVSDSNQNNAYLASLRAQKSPFDRYLAVSNPDSLLSHVGISLSGYASSSFSSSLFTMLNKVLDPIKSMGALIGQSSMLKASAALNATSTNTYYGNIQFGYTQAENALIENDESYSPLANQQVLDLSGQEQAISDMYADCFNGSKTMGKMLSEGLIKRDTNGDVLDDDSLCSPRSLGLQNSAYGTNMVFRWRLAQSYNNAMDQIIDQQDVTN